MDKAISNQLSTAQVARMLGVGVSTVKRWVDDQILPAHKTPGGHRKILLSDVMRLAKDGQFPALDMSQLGGTPAEPIGDADSLREPLTKALIAGDEDEVRVRLHHAFYGGMPLVTLADQVLAPALAAVGHAWESETIDVMHEHRATQLCASVLYELKAVLENQAQADRPLALGGAPEGDPYIIPSLLVEMVLLELGWQVVNLGPNTPLVSLALGLTQYKPKLMWISASHIVDEAFFRREYLPLRAQAELLGVPIAIGGQGFSESLRTSLSYTTFGDGMTQLASFAKALHPMPQRPRRGRPPTREADRA
jgi:excisionase family DNA binding protein